MKSKSLPNELKEAMPPDVWLLPYLRAAQSGDPNELNKYWVRWRELECKNFEILFKNYEIDPNSQKWLRLFEQHSPIYKWNPGGLLTAKRSPQSWRTRGAPKNSFYAAFAS